MTQWMTSTGWCLPRVFAWRGADSRDMALPYITLVAQAMQIAMVAAIVPMMLTHDAAGGWCLADSMGCPKVDFDNRIATFVGHLAIIQGIGAILGTTAIVRRLRDVGEDPRLAVALIVATFALLLVNSQFFDPDGLFGAFDLTAKFVLMGVDLMVAGVIAGLVQRIRRAILLPGYVATY